MGYWITHNIKITGTKKELDILTKKLQEPHPGEVNEEGDIVWSDEGIDSVSLYNLSPPPEDMLITEKWWGDEGHAWRMENWDCSYAWQATEFNNYNETLYIRFETKYDWPVTVFKTFIENNPTLEVYVWSEGEESEALEISGKNGLYDVVEYASPASHADWVARENEDSCRCGWADEEDDWFDDCPREEEQEYLVHVITTHKVKAYSSERAKEVVFNFENGFDIPTGEIIQYAVSTNYTAEEVK
jgi:hypothetical protein